MTTGAWIAFWIIMGILIFSVAFCMFTDLYKGGKYRSVGINRIGKTILGHKPGELRDKDQLD
jgi:hypothetical protein